MKKKLNSPDRSGALPCSALDIADIQQLLIDEHARMMWAIKNLPIVGTGSLTNRHKMRGAIDFGVSLSNWISRRQIEDDENAKLQGNIVSWGMMDTAPDDGSEFIVYCPGKHGLNHMASICAWHEDAGFCVDELREPSFWISLPNARGEARPSPPPQTR